MRARRTIILVGMVVVVVLGLVLPAVQVCRDWAFIDRNTGSRKGYREWSLGWRSGSWYQESGVEAFMRSNYPAGFRQDWVSYAGTGRNIFGGATLYGHGRPGPILSLIPEVLDRYCQSASDADKRQLYDVLASADEQKIRETIDCMTETVLDAGLGKTEPDGAANRSQPIRAEKNRTSVTAGSDR